MPILRGSTSACMLRPSSRVSASVSPASSIWASIGASGAMPLASMAESFRKAERKSATLAGKRARGRGTCVVENRRNLPAGHFVDVVPDRPTVPAGRDQGRFQPGAIGVREEIVARRDVRVDGALQRRRGAIAGRLRPSVRQERPGRERQQCNTEWHATREGVSAHG